MASLTHDARSSGHGVRSELQVYLEEINRTPLLTADEEREVGWAIINDDCPLARERMIRSNLRLVVAIGKNFVNRGLPLGDLIEEGNIGLMRAVDGFDPAQGTRFSTYASWWIKQAIKRALINARQPVHIPAYMVELISKWKIASRRLEQQNGVPPTVEQLARELDLPLKKVNIIKRAINALKSPSQEGTGASDDLMSLGEMISDSSVGTPDDRVLQSEQINVLRRLLETIDPREATVLRLRFGLDGRDPLTLKEIAGEIGISRERVRQVVEEALTRLHDRLNDAKPSQFFRRDDAHVKAPASRGPQLVG